MLLRRAHASVGVKLVCRAVRMTRACLALLTAEEADLLLEDAGGLAARAPRAREVLHFDGQTDAREETDCDCEDSEGDGAETPR